MQSAGISIPGVLNLAQSFGYDKVNRLISAVWCIEGLGSTGRELAFKVENAVDMETGTIVAVTTHGGAVADTTTVEATVIEAGVAVAEVAGEDAPAVNADGVQEIVADRAITATKWFAVWRSCRYGAISLSRSEGHETGKGKRPKRLPLCARVRRSTRRQNCPTQLPTQMGTFGD